MVALIEYKDSEKPYFEGDIQAEIAWNNPSDEGTIEFRKVFEQEINKYNINKKN